MPQKLEDEIVSLIERFRGRLPDEFANEYISLARHNECVIALENLCVQLYEFDIYPTEQEYKAIVEIGAKTNMNAMRWTFFAPGHP